MHVCVCIRKKTSQSNSDGSELLLWLLGLLRKPFIRYLSLRISPLPIAIDGWVVIWSTRYVDIRGKFELRHDDETDRRVAYRMARTLEDGLRRVPNYHTLLYR